MRHWIMGLVLVGGIAAAHPAPACGADTDCVLDIGGTERTYRIRLPQTPSAAPMGAILYAHGYKGSAAGAMRNKALEALAGELGIAFVAAKSFGDDWMIPGVPSHTRNGVSPDGSEELAYFDALVADITGRFGIDPDRILMTGFSAGGMVTWTLACHRGGMFAGFAPIAGTFWRPVPETCTSPVTSLVHIHGTEDRIVPLGGRPIAQTHQGDVPRALAMYRDYGGFGEAAREQRGDLDCEMRENADGAVLDYCAFVGGHSFRTAHLRMAWKRLMGPGGS
ncbi:MAG: polyhydroxybutyrate depolymerase [Pseudomonadota bacterium]